MVFGARSLCAFVSPSDVGSAGSLDSDFRAVMRVLTTQIGLVINTVALPASAPAAIDSSVLSLFFFVVLWKNARENSYPVPCY